MKRRRHLTFVLTLLAATAGFASGQSTFGPVQAANGNYYEIIYYPSPTDAVDWNKAEGLARLRTSVAGASAVHLATIETAAEDVFIEELRQQALTAAGLDPHANSAPPLWVGGFQPANQASVGANWLWVNGNRPINGMARYTNWLPGEPNDWNTAGVEDNQENYLAIGLRGTFSWNDAGNLLQGYVVEYEMDFVGSSIDGDWGPNGHYYRVVVKNESLTWNDAAREAWWQGYSGLRGHLATITTVEEHKFIEDLRLRSGDAWGVTMWLGGRQESDQASADRGWNWLNDEGAIGGTVGGSGYSGWYTNEPNDWPTAAEDNGENELVLSRNNSVWNDGSGVQRGYVVEFEEAPEQELIHRSTRYPGNSSYEFSSQPRFSRQVAMTVEAWVYREDASRTEAVLSHGGIADGFFFGFAGEKIRFGRSGGFAVLSNDPVPSKQWTHVAVSYDGTTARFYVDGANAGAIPLQHSGWEGSHPLRLGATVGGGVARFRGSLDEVRLWSGARPASQIAGNRFRELDAASGESNLEFVSPAGDGREVVSGPGVSGYVVREPGATAPVLQRTGMLPMDLVVPQAAVPPKLDGNVDPTGEYAGAEEMVLRYSDGPVFADARAYLVHDKEFLYVGIEGARLPTGGSPSADNVLEVFFDPAGSTTTFNGELGRGQLFLQDSLSAYAKVGQRFIENPITGGQTTINVWEAGDPTSLEYLSFQGSERLNELTTVRDVEFRFHRSLLSDLHLDAFDRLAVRHADHGGPGTTSWAPEGAGETQPVTWAKVHYTPIRGDSLPVVWLSGTVESTASGEGLSDMTVELSGNTSVIATTTTNASGRYSFSSVTVGVGETLRLRVVLPEGAEAGTPVVSAPGTSPSVVGSAEVIFPGCTTGLCTYAPVAFQVTMPLPATELGAYSPGRIYPPVVTRRGPTLKTTGTIPIQLDVANAHDDLTFYLLMDHCPNDPTASALCEEGVDYFRLDAIRVEPEGLPPYYELRIPDPAGGAPEVPYPRAYRLAAHDTWARPANNPTSPASWRYATGTVLVTAPPYELLHGFPFINIGDGHDFDDYRAAFYDQICNPLFMVGAWAYAPIYLETLGGGECVGMVATASRFARGKFDTGPGSSLHTEHGEVLFGNGFPVTGDRQPVLPARFDVSNPCSPKPLNIWGKIRANHGVQLSSEFIGQRLAQFELGEHGLVIDHADALDKIRSRPLDFQLCFRDGDKGHCVQPLRVIDTVRDESGTILPNRHDIEVWDPNYPGTIRTMELTIEPGQPGQYFYDGFSPAWSGNWVFVFEIDEVWDGERHVPSVDTLGVALAQFGVDSLAALLQLIVSGEAEPMVSSAGGAVGWDGAGNFSETGSSTLALPQFNWIPNDTPPLGHYPATIVHRLDAGTPTVTMHNRGESYKVHSSHLGTMFQLFVDGGLAGTDDTVGFATPNGKVEGISFAAGSGGRSVAGRIALCRDGASYPAALGFDALPVPNGQSLAMRQLPGASGVELFNETGAAMQPVWRLAQPTATNGGSGPEETELPRVDVPAGASMTVRSVGGLDFENLALDVDLNRDGLPEFSAVYIGATGQFVQMTPGSGPELDVTVANGVVMVSWQEIPGWDLAVSQDLVAWSRVNGVVVQNGIATWSGQGMAEHCFFRLERWDP